MILSGRAIKNTSALISSSSRMTKRVNPNSYNLSLHNELLVYTGNTLDMKQTNPQVHPRHTGERLVSSQTGCISARTNEYTKTEPLYVPMLERSSTGRLGLFIHATARFGISALRAIGRWRFSASSRCVFTRMWRSARFITTISAGISTCMQAGNAEQYGHSAEPDVPGF